MFDFFDYSLDFIFLLDTCVGRVIPNPDHQPGLVTKLFGLVFAVAAVRSLATSRCKTAEQ